MEKRTLRETAKANAITLIEANLDTYNEWAHNHHTHIWLEAWPDGEVHQTEEASMQTTHWLDYPNHPVATILEIARCEYCDCGACASFDDASNPNITNEEFEEKWGYSREDVSGSFAQHLKDYEVYDFDMVDRALAAIDDIEFGYFDDEE